MEGGKPENPEKIHQNKVRTNNKLICDASSRIQTQATLIDAVSLNTVPTLLPTAFGELNVTAYMYIHVINRGYYMPAYGYEFYLLVVNSISHS